MNPTSLLLAFALALGCLATISGTACTSEDRSATRRASSTSVSARPSAEGPTASTAPPRAPTNEEDEVRVAFLESSSAYYEALENPDPDDPNLIDAQTGALLENSRMVMRDLRSQGVIATYPNGRPTVQVIRISVTGDAASVRACVTDSGVQIRKADGMTVNDSVDRYLLEAGLVRQQGTWKVATASSGDSPDDTCPR